MSLDRIDRKILSALQDDNKITNLELAERIGISPPACLRRVKALRNQKIIEGDISLINPTALGKQITVVIEIVVARAGTNVVDKVKRKMLTTPEVSQCYLVTGDTDFIVIAQLKDMEAYEAFLERTFYNDSIIETMTSLVVVNRVKFNPKLDIPIDD